MNSSDPSRRDVLRHAFHALALIPAAALVGCSSKADCSDVSALSPEDVTARNNANYLDPSPDAEKHCEKCKLYTAPPKEGACGGCTVIKGPIAAKASCTLFAAKT